MTTTQRYRIEEFCNHNGIDRSTEEFLKMYWGDLCSLVQEVGPDFEVLRGKVEEAEQATKDIESDYKALEEDYQTLEATCDELYKELRNAKSKA